LQPLDDLSVRTIEVKKAHPKIVYKVATTDAHSSFSGKLVLFKSGPPLKLSTRAAVSHKPKDKFKPYFDMFK
jgi:hypothetical protein